MSGPEKLEISLMELLFQKIIKLRNNEFALFLYLEENAEAYLDREAT